MCVLSANQYKIDLSNYLCIIKSPTENDSAFAADDDEEDNNEWWQWGGGVKQ